jgi:hypothetical protein
LTKRRNSDKLQPEFGHVDPPAVNEYWYLYPQHTYFISSARANQTQHVTLLWFTTCVNRKDDGDGLVGGFALHEAVEVLALQELLLPHKSREGGSPALSQHLGTNYYLTEFRSMNGSGSSI